MSKDVTFSCRTQDNSDPSGKPRVYFTCHPDDFDRTFDKICNDIFRSHSCAIYYTEDMNAELTSENNLVDLERMNLFVIPVTRHLLTQKSRAMDHDYWFAAEKQIPVLPLMMESDLDHLYKSPEKFGGLQYLDPYGKDKTAIDYEDKLKMYLESVLISDELAQKIRGAFDAYIFLSYRKKDRAYANNLMKLIHSDINFRDVAIWFDEYLKPGENFKDNIEKMLNKSALFTLLVTPNLLEKPNFVMDEEYPAAKKANKIILPAEMKTTDIQKLKAEFENACKSTKESLF